jgi:uncharacterized protein YbjT (DUF2867 family)
MNKTLVTGGTGLLGKEVVSRLLAKGRPVRILTTQPAPVVPVQVEVCRGDLVSADGLQAAVKHCNTIIHCASNPRAFQETDKQGTENLLNAIDRDAPPHFIYISIVGVDKSDYPYYVVKNQVENMIAESGIPFTILRTTQFHHFVYNLIQALVKTNQDVLEIPDGMKFQSIELSEVAEKLIAIAEGKPNGLLPNFCGPQVLRFEEYVQQYLDITNDLISYKAVPLQGPRYDLFRSGINLCGVDPAAKITWKDFVAKSI